MIIQNAVYITSKNKFLVSTHTHDFVSEYLDDGTLVAVDGGYNYFRRFGMDNEDVVDFSLTDDHDFEYIVDKMLWGTYGKDGNNPLQYVRLLDCTTEHLKAILEQDHIKNSDKGTLGFIVRKVCKKILESRKD